MFIPLDRLPSSYYAFQYIVEGFDGNVQAFLDRVNVGNKSPYWKNLYLMKTAPYCISPAKR
jgi:hypothetical protein